MEGEEPPIACVQSKRFITKVMFLTAIAQPRHNPDTNSMFDGLIGIFPFIRREEAKRSSKNRPKGTIVTKPLDSIGRTEITDMLVNKVMPAIREKFPASSRGENIMIQQDNARPHAKSDDVIVNAAGKTNGWNIGLTCQPPNSPDLNVLDLGYFRSIQSIKDTMSPANVDELIDCVTQSYWDQPLKTTENIFLTLQKVMECIMLEEGGNKYSLPHMAKDKMRRELGHMPLSIQCSEEAVDRALGMLQL